MRLLLVEDDLPLGAGMKRALEHAGYVVDWAKAGDEAVAGARAQSYDAILLDLSLPYMSGIEALKAIRADRDVTPVVIVTANDRSEQKVEGLDAGADDYLVKPFDLDELLARIRAHIRRQEQRPTNVLSAGRIQLDIAAWRVTQGDEAVSLTAKEFKVLRLLMRRCGQFVSKGELESALYDDTAEIESNTIEVTIYNLRRKFQANFIITARGLGYMVPK